MNQTDIQEDRPRKFFAVAVAGLCLATSALIGPVRADDNGGGHDKAGSKPKMVFTVGPVTKTPDPKGKAADGKGKGGNGGGGQHH
jgi:hypothetical protein